MATHPQNFWVYPQYINISCLDFQFQFFSHPLWFCPFPFLTGLFICFVFECEGIFKGGMWRPTTWFQNVLFMRTIIILGSSNILRGPRHRNLPTFACCGHLKAFYHNRIEKPGFQWFQFFWGKGNALTVVMDCATAWLLQWFPFLDAGPLCTYMFIV